MKLSDVQKENCSSEIAKKVCKLLKKEGMLAKKVTLVTVYTLNHFQQLVQRVKESLPRATEFEVMDAITRWKKDRSKRNEEAMIDVLSIFRGDRSNPKFWVGIRSRKRFIDTEQKAMLNGIERYILGAEQHDSGTIARDNYRVFIDTETQPFYSFSGFKTKVKASKRKTDGSYRRLYQYRFTDCDVERLSYHPQMRPSFTHQPLEAVMPSEIPDTDLDESSRHGNATNMTIAEQNCQAFYLSCWYGKYELLNELAATDDACYKAEIKKMEDTMANAQACWDAKWKKSTTERVKEGLQMIARQCSPCCKRKREDSDDEADKRMRV